MNPEGRQRPLFCEPHAREGLTHGLVTPYPQLPTFIKDESTAHLISF